MRIATSTIRSLTGTNSGALQSFFMKQGESRLVRFQIKHNDVPTDITGYVFTSELSEITADSAMDTANGYSISGPVLKTGGNTFNLTSNISVIQANVGNVQLYIPATVSSVEAELAATVPVMYYGYFAVNNGSNPDPEIYKAPILVVVTNDGV